MPDLWDPLPLPRGTDLVQWHDLTAMTGADGAFTVSLPAKRITVDPSAKLTLTMRGANGQQAVEIDATLPGMTGYVGEIRLREALRPLPKSILATLTSDLAWTAGVPAAQPGTPTTPRTTAQVK